MKILIVGSEERFIECKQKFATDHEFVLAGDYANAKRLVAHVDVAFDFLIERDVQQVSIYPDQLPVFFNTVRVTLQSLIAHRPAGIAFGFNGLPGFVYREYLEVCLVDSQRHEALEKLLHQLDTKFEIVSDQIGMVTPRVICMIINEAYLTAEEGTASRADIDLAMKLGTNYPYGPFEWAQRMGVREVHSLLVSLKNSIDSERYTISELLRSEAEHS